MKIREWFRKTKPAPATPAPVATPPVVETPVVVAAEATASKRDVYDLARRNAIALRKRKKRAARKARRLNR